MKIQKTPVCRWAVTHSKVQTKRKGEIEKTLGYLVDHNGNKIEKKWYVVDATDVPLGRLAGQIAMVLMGKNKPYYTPHLDTGDFVIVVNADKVKLTGNKLDQKKYYRYSGYPGGIKERTARQMMEKFPDRVVRLAVKRMLPKKALGERMLKKLKVYSGPEHEHAAQKPELIELVK